MASNSKEQAFIDRNKTITKTFKKITPKQFISKVFKHYDFVAIRRCDGKDVNKPGNEFVKKENIFDEVTSNTWAIPGGFSSSTSTIIQYMTSLSSFVIDIDNVKPNQTKKLLKLIEHGKVPCSFIVSTGGGIHCHITLNETYKLNNTEDKISATETLKKLQNIYAKKMPTAKIDSLSIAQAYRMPGFPVKKEISETELAQAFTTNNIYDINEIINLTKHVKAKKLKIKEKHTNNTEHKKYKHTEEHNYQPNYKGSHDEPLKHNNIKMPWYFWEAYQQGIRKRKIKYGKRNTSFFALGSISSKIGLTYEEASAVLKGIYENCVEDKDDFEDTEATISFQHGRQAIYTTKEWLRDALCIIPRTKKHKFDFIHNQIKQAVLELHKEGKLISVNNLCKKTNRYRKTIKNHVSAILNELVKEISYINNNTFIYNSTDKEKIKEQQKLKKQYDIDTKKQLKIKYEIIGGVICQTRHYENQQNVSHPVISNEIKNIINKENTALKQKQIMMNRIISNSKKFDFDINKMINTTPKNKITRSIGEIINKIKNGITVNKRIVNDKHNNEKTENRYKRNVHGNSEEALSSVFKQNVLVQQSRVFKREKLTVNKSDKSEEENKNQKIE